MNLADTLCTSNPDRLQQSSHLYPWWVSSCDGGMIRSYQQWRQSEVRCKHALSCPRLFTRVILVNLQYWHSLAYLGRLLSCKSLPSALHLTSSGSLAHNHGPPSYSRLRERHRRAALRAAEKDQHCPRVVRWGPKRCRADLVGLVLFAKPPGTTYCALVSWYSPQVRNSFPS